MGHFVFNVSMISSKMSCSSIYVLFMSYQNLTWKCWDTTYVTSDCNFGNYCRLQCEASFFRKWRSQTYPNSWPKREKRKKKNQQKVKTKKTQTNKLAKSPIFKIRERGWGCIYLDFNVIFRIQPKTFLHAPQMVGRASSIFNVLYVNLRIMSVIWKRWCVPILFSCKKKKLHWKMSPPVYIQSVEVVYLWRVYLRY